MDQTPEKFQQAPSGGPSDALRLLLLVGAVLLANLPLLSKLEVENEEGRRLLPAREMLETGEWVEPRIWGRPYLAKPPLYYWCVAATARGLRAAGLGDLGRIELEDLHLDALSKLAHRDPVASALGPGPLPDLSPVSPLAARLASLVFSAAAVALVFLLCRRSLGATASTVAAGCMAGAPTLMAKATLGEIEMALTALCFAGTAAAWLGLRGRWVWSVVGGLAIGAAVLAKGPIAFAFALPPLWLAAALERDGRGRALARAALATFLSLAVPGIWLALLLDGQQSNVGQTWAGELARGGPGSAWVYLSDRLRLVSGVLLGWLPASLVALAGWRSWRGSSLGRFATVALVAGMLLLLAWPGVRARYALPLLPWASVLAGVAFDGSETARRVSRGAARGLSFALLPVLVLALPFVLVGIVIYPEGVTAGDPPKWTVVTIGLVAFASAVEGTRRLRAGGPAGAALVALACFAFSGRLVERSMIEPFKLHKDRRALGAAVLREVVDDPGATVRVGRWAQFNLLYYTGWRGGWANGPDDVAPGELWLCGADRPAPEPAREWTLLAAPAASPWVPTAPSAPAGAYWTHIGLLGPEFVGGDLAALALWKRLPPPAGGADR
ncbi:ArnT family glycosyltransferase [Engelhardtia mirabilis]|uniref:Dolichyl-phosphate-mannose-protein mannosyltransferase n=1 Tax=Engelhardtia mirabilis TaxID=2528011 RepID=A0A518BQW2_9BACT|nr:Dolichyl-phosphate-mannose-protein mannosyltransferase [Planctomycetes bacterium Pla133]QDV03681.1 Dolichyl-phosphate-mannose-protein mannosyltransferase [Planctomycetes bacterium Pla86]